MAVPGTDVSGASSLIDERSCLPTSRVVPFWHGPGRFYAIFDASGAPALGIG
jgi:hypothetical protein